MGYPLEQAVEEVAPPKKVSLKWYKNWMIITAAIILIIALSAAGMFYYQTTHFNSNVDINEVDVSGLTAEQALSKLQATVLTNEIYIGDQLVLAGEETNMAYTEADLPEIKSLLESQYTFFPSSEATSFHIMPVETDSYRDEELRSELEQTLLAMNQDLEAPVDAEAYIENGEILISESAAGEQFDISGLLVQYDKQEYTHNFYLEAEYLQPVTEDSDFVASQVERLEDFLNHTVEYEIQDQVYSLQAGELISDAALSDEMEVVIHGDTIHDTVSEISGTHSTLGKDFTFTTHSGSVISVEGKGYGWALETEKEAEAIHAAFVNGEKSISASNTYGNGWQGEGYGFDVTSNDGIGGTYAEVSLAEQRMWIYKDGELVVTTNVVTGNESTDRGTLPGVWYILYKTTDYTLNGVAADGERYATDVKYWAPFTNSGQGFHDADWRTNWSGNAYLNAGSNGCVNIPPDVMKKVYDNLSPYDPVVIY